MNFEFIVKSYIICKIFFFNGSAEIRPSTCLLPMYGTVKIRFCCCHKLIDNYFKFLLTANEMNNITQNFRLGFGSFVDKVVMPYVSMAPNK